MDDLTSERAVLAPQQINLGISDIGLRGFQFAPAAARFVLSRRSRRLGLLAFPSHRSTRRQVLRRSDAIQ